MFGDSLARNRGRGSVFANGVSFREVREDISGAGVAMRGVPSGLPLGERPIGVCHRSVFLVGRAFPILSLEVCGVGAIVGIKGGDGIRARGFGVYAIRAIANRWCRDAQSGA